MISSSCDKVRKSQNSCDDHLFMMLQHGPQNAPEAPAPEKQNPNREKPLSSENVEDPWHMSGSFGVWIWI